MKYEKFMIWRMKMKCWHCQSARAFDTRLFMFIWTKVALIPRWGCEDWSTWGRLSEAKEASLPLQVIASHPLSINVLCWCLNKLNPGTLVIWCLTVSSSQYQKRFLEFSALTEILFIYQHWLVQIMGNINLRFGTIWAYKVFSMVDEYYRCRKWNKSYS